MLLYYQFIFDFSRYKNQEITFGEAFTNGKIAAARKRPQREKVNQDEFIDYFFDE